MSAVEALPATTKTCEGCGIEFGRKKSAKFRSWRVQRFCSRPCAQTHTGRKVGKHNTDRSIPAAERIEASSTPIPHAGCWIWMGSRKGSYGKSHVNGISTSAHRASYEATKGPIPAGLHIDHLCMTPLCVNPEHLEAVTPEENNRRAQEARAKEPEATKLRRQIRGTRRALATLEQKLRNLETD